MKLNIIALSLLSTTVISGFILASSSVSADDTAVDEVNISVPVSCSLTGTVDAAHTKEINNGIYQPNIGTTTLKALCNDSGGFAIYAIGYTDNEEGKTVLASSALGSSHDIVTGTATSGNTSNWAMKLATDSSATYAITLAGSSSDPEKEINAPDFSDYTAVPGDYAKVAYRNSNTDNVAGASLTTTYAAYISGTQPAGTYVGQVKYVLVHPSTGDEPVKSDQIAVNYDGNGLLFANSATKNKVFYGSTCTPMYMGTTPRVAETSNLTNGVQSGDASYASDEHVLATEPFSGADKIRVVIDYGMTDEASITVVEGSWGGWDDSDPSGNYDEINTWDLGGNVSGTKTYTFDSDTATVEFYAYDEPESDYNYGMYARFYPIYETEQSGTEEISVCSYGAINGTYATTTTWRGKWFVTVNGETTWFTDESAVVNYLAENDSTLLGTTLTVYAYNPYTIIYNGNNATAGTMSNFTTSVNTMSSTADLMAPNFYKTGYGFAGWSENQNATVNGSDTIYGPNEKITGTNLTFDSASHQTTLYAVWVPTSGTMQSFSCSSLNSGQVTALTDSRDSNVYTVGKMQDGNCWMMENLRLDDSVSAATIASGSQGIGGNFTKLPASSTSWGTSSSYYTTAQFNNNNTQMSNDSLTATPGQWNGNYWDEEQSNNGEYGDIYKWYGYGNYYSWAAAIANTTAYSSNNAGVASANTSICPSGWQLPIGGQTNNTKSFSYLDTQMGGTGDYQSDNDGEEIVSNRWRSYPNNFVYSGYWSESSANTRGNFGYYWSSSAYSSGYAYFLFFNSIYVGPGANSNRKYYGISVRCVAGS